MAKQRKPTTKKELEQDEALKQNLDKATERTAAASGQDAANKYQLAAQKGAELLQRSNKRRDYESDKGRKRYNTMMHPDLKQKLNETAAGLKVSVPDLIEEILCKQLGIKPPSE